MSIDQIDKIDIITTTPEDKVMLTISDHLEWDDTGEHMLLLQDKLNAYLQFIESGQIFDDYPVTKNKQVIISIAMKYIPNETALIFLSRSKEVILNAGIEFEWRIINSVESFQKWHMRTTYILFYWGLTNKQRLKAKPVFSFGMTSIFELM